MASQQFFALLIIWVQLSKYGSSILIDGIFMEPTLKPGYNLVATIPKGAKALNVTELRNTSNFLAIRLSDGRFALNGNYAIAWSGMFEAAGTTFTYFRQNSDHLESIAADGPLQEPVDIMVLYQELNPGIVYRYVRSGKAPKAPAAASGPNYMAATGKTSNMFLPNAHSRRNELSSSTYGVAGDQAQPPVKSPMRRLRRRRFAWKNAGLSDCNKSCGSGVRTTRFICVRELSQLQVPERRCHHLEKPIGQTIRCNTLPCPAKWRGGTWSSCSVTCGSGIRTRELECVQEVTPVLTMRVADGACIEPKELQVSEACRLAPCDNPSKAMIEHKPVAPTWNTGAWSECSASCGSGKRTRLITCITDGRACLPHEKPAAQETCNLGECPTQAPAVQNNSVADPPSGNSWLYTEWSQQCSAECGTGIQWRRVLCETSESGESCKESTKPETTRECSTDLTCSGHWFTGPWSQCTPSCDIGEQSRGIACLAVLRGALRIVLDMNCPVDKPESRRQCTNSPCGASWFVSEWSPCTKSCGTGMQKREVKCLGSSDRIPDGGWQCKDAERPQSRTTCNEQPCQNYVVQVQNDPEMPNGRSQVDPSCKDSYTNCLLVAQARLCNYKIYETSCCESCFRARRDYEE